MSELTGKESLKLWNKVKKLKNVVGFSSSLKPRIKKGKAKVKEPCFRVYVSKKVKLRSLSVKDRVPSILKAEGEPVLTDIVVIGDIKPLKRNGDSCPKIRTKGFRSRGGHKDKYRPLVAGISACHIDCTACTIGFFGVKDNTPVIICNNHCGALENKAIIGDTYIQPSSYDGGNASDKVGTLMGFVPIKFNEYECKYRNALHRLLKFIKLRRLAINKVDLAWIRIMSGIDTKREMLGIGEAPKGVIEAKVGDAVTKSGRTTGVTSGVVIDTNWSGNIRYSRGIVLFTDQILIQGNGFSAGGDSSSGILTSDDKKACGLLFAGSASHTVANKIQNVIDEGGLEIALIHKWGLPYVG